jgi:hypothetical protein
VRIKLKEGIKFSTYPVLTVTNANEVEASSETKLVVESVTSKPVRQTYYPSINSGYLEYKLTSNATKIEISRLNFIVDDLVSYGNVTIADAIQVTSTVNGVVENQASMDVKVLAPAFVNLWTNKNSLVPPQLS